MKVLLIISIRQQYILHNYRMSSPIKDKNMIAIIFIDFVYVYISWSSKECTFKEILQIVFLKLKNELDTSFFRTKFSKSVGFFFVSFKIFSIFWALLR